jgi:hypothetical protein
MWLEELMKPKKKHPPLQKCSSTIDHGIASYIQFDTWLVFGISFLLFWCTGYGINERVQVTVNT